MNSCDFYQELISRMLDDELNNNERSVLAEHLYMCDECAAMYSAFSMVSDMVATDLVEPPEELAEDVMAHIRRAEIRKRNRRNTRATKNAITAAACVAFVVAAVGGVAVVKSHRSDNVVYESRMSQSTAASSAKDGSFDTVIISETPAVQNGAEQYVAPVEKYTAAPQQEEKTSFFASILPDSWFSAATPAPTPSPVIYATPVATPYVQDAALPNANAQAQNNMPAVVVVPPTETQSPVVVISPAPTEAPVVEFSDKPEELVPEVLPAVTEAPVAETLPVVTEPPASEAPVETEAPVNELPVETEAPITETPVETEVPVAETPLVTEAPSAETPVVTEAPVLDFIPATELPLMDFAAAPEASLPELPVDEQFRAESAVPGEAIEELIPAQPQQDSISGEAPIEEASAETAAGPVLASHDFSTVDCAEFIDALFTSKKAEGDPAAQEDTVEADNAAGEGQSEYASCVDKLIAVKNIELCPLPENAEAQRVDTLSFSADNQIFSVQVSFYGENIYVQGFTADGTAISFHTALSPAEYDAFLSLCYTLNDNG